ncbi:hypothetical protein ACFQL4_20150 [Halosimplex aquaticum]
MQWKWVLRRLGMGFLVTYITITLTFFMIRLMPGSPIDRMRAELYQRYGATMSDAEINRQVRLYLNVKPDEPLWRQYIDYVVTTFQGNMGYSYIQGVEVSTLLRTCCRGRCSCSRSRSRASTSSASCSGR